MAFQRCGRCPGGAWCAVFWQRVVRGASSRRRVVLGVPAARGARRVVPAARGAWCNCGLFGCVWACVHVYTFHESCALLAPSLLGIVPFRGHTYRSCRCVEQGRPSQSFRSLLRLWLFGRRVSGLAGLCSAAAISTACRLRVCLRISTVCRCRAGVTISTVCRCRAGVTISTVCRFRAGVTISTVCRFRAGLGGVLVCVSIAPSECPAI